MDSRTIGGSVAEWKLVSAIRNSISQYFYRDTSLKLSQATQRFVSSLDTNVLFGGLSFGLHRATSLARRRCVPSC